MPDNDAATQLHIKLINLFPRQNRQRVSCWRQAQITDVVRCSAKTLDCVVRQRRFAEQDIAAANAADLNLIIADLGIKNVKRCALDDDLSEVVILVAITNAELFIV